MSFIPLNLAQNVVRCQVSIILVCLCYKAIMPEYYLFSFPFFNVKLIMQTIIFFLNYPVDKLRELAWSGVPDYMRPTVWRLLLVSSMISKKHNNYNLKSSDQNFLGYVYSCYILVISKQIIEGGFQNYSFMEI